MWKRGSYDVPIGRGRVAWGEEKIEAGVREMIFSDNASADA